MTELIIVAMALALLQTLLPTMLNTKNLAYLASNRDKDVEFAPVVKRLKNAARNLMESLPIFLTLATLALILEVNIEREASSWLVFRVAYVICYGAGIAYLRTLIWAGSIVSLILMATKLV